MRHLLRHRSVDGDDEEAINLAIEVVGESRDDSLVHQLVEFLMGDVDGSPKVWWRVENNLTKQTFLNFFSVL